MQRYKQLPIIRYGSKKSMIKKDKKHVSKSTLLKSKIQASANARLGLNKKNSPIPQLWTITTVNPVRLVKNSRIRELRISLFPPRPGINTLQEIKPTG